MSKVKMSKKSTAIDMTAMCDVSFLLLTFFILTATAKQPEVLPVDMPASTVKAKLPASDLAVITVGNEGRAYFAVKGPEVRRRTLEIISQKYNMQFSKDELESFGNMEDFGVSMAELKGLLQLKSAERNKKGLQKGIPHDSIDNQLKEWVKAARAANAEIMDKQLDFAIKGDAKEGYPQIKKVMDILQDENVNKFHLVTGMRSEDF